MNFSQHLILLAFIFMAYFAGAATSSTVSTAAVSSVGATSPENRSSDTSPVVKKLVKKKKFLNSGGQRGGHSANSTLRMSNDDDDNDGKKIMGSIEVSRSNSLYDLKNGSKYEGIDYLASLNYLLGPGWVSTQLGVSQDLDPNAEKTSVLNDSNLAYTQKPFPIYKNSRSVNLSWAPSVAGLIPLSEKSQKVDQLQTSIIVSANLKIIAGEDSKMRGGGLVASISAGQNFHRYETDVNGVILNRNSSNQSLSAFYSIGDFTLTLSQAHRIRWPYKGEVRTSFDLSQDISYAVAKSWSVSLGHTNSGSTLKPNGYDSNVSLLSEDTSIIYIGMAYGF